MPQKFVLHFLALSVLLLLNTCSDTTRLKKLNREFKNHNNTIAPIFPGWDEYLTPESLNQHSDFTAVFADKLHTVNPEHLSVEHKKLYQDLNTTLTLTQRFLLQLQTDPSYFNLPIRWKATFSDRPSPADFLMLLPQLKAGAVYYQDIRKLLSNPDPVLCRKAVEEHIQTLPYLNQLTTQIQKASLTPTQKSQLQLALTQTKIAVKDYIAWCNSQAFENYQRNKLPSHGTYQ